MGISFCYKILTFYIAKTTTVVFLFAPSCNLLPNWELTSLRKRKKHSGKANIKASF